MSKLQCKCVPKRCGCCKGVGLLVEQGRPQYYLPMKQYTASAAADYEYRACGFCQGSGILAGLCGHNEYKIRIP